MTCSFRPVYLPSQQGWNVFLEVLTSFFYLVNFYKLSCILYCTIINKLLLINLTVLLDWLVLHGYILYYGGTHCITGLQIVLQGYRCTTGVQVYYRGTGVLQGYNCASKKFKDFYLVYDAFFNSFPSPPPFLFLLSNFNFNLSSFGCFYLLMCLRGDII